MSSQEHLVENDTLEQSIAENQITREAEEKEPTTSNGEFVNGENVSGKNLSNGKAIERRQDDPEDDLSSKSNLLNKNEESAVESENKEPTQSWEEGSKKGESATAAEANKEPMRSLDEESKKGEITIAAEANKEPMLSLDGEIKNGDTTTEESNATIETSLDDPSSSNVTRVETDNTTSQNKSMNSSIIMQSDVTDFIEFKKDILTENSSGMKYVSSFRLEFEDVAGFSTISPTKAWVHNHHKLKLVDIERGEVMRSYYSESPFDFVHGLNESIVFLSFHYEIDRLSVNEDGTNTLATLLNFSSGIEQSSQCKLNAFCVSKSGDFLVCLTRRTGCLCLTKEISFIERFDSRATFMKRSKIENKGHYLIRQAYDVVESNNGDICIAGEKYKDRGEYWVIVLDSKFQYRFSYDRNTSSQIHVPASMSTDRRNNVLIVNKFRDRVKPKKTPLTTTKKKKQLTYVAIIDEDGIFREHLPTEGFHNDGTVCQVTVDSDGRIWMILGSGQIVVATFDYLSKCTDNQTVTEI